MKKSTFSDNVFQTIFWRFWLGFGCENGSQVRPLRVCFYTFSANREKCDFERPSNGFAMFFLSCALFFRDLKPRFSRLFPKWFLRHFFVIFSAALVYNWGPKPAPKACKQCVRFFDKIWCRKDAEKVMQERRERQAGPVCVPKRKPETSTRDQTPITSVKGYQNISITPLCLGARWRICMCIDVIYDWFWFLPSRS